MADYEDTMRWLHLMRPGGGIAAMECQYIAAELLPILEAARQTLAACQAEQPDAALAALSDVAAAGMELADQITEPLPPTGAPSAASLGARKAWETRVRKYGPSGRRPCLIDVVDF